MKSFRYQWNARLWFVLKHKMRSAKHAVKWKLLLAFCCVSYAVFFQIKSLLNSSGFGITGSSGWKTLEGLLLQLLRILKFCRSFICAYCLGQYYDLRERYKLTREAVDRKQRFLCLSSLKNITALWGQRQFLAGVRQTQQSFHLAD